MIKNRIELAQEFADFGFTKGAEIGVADGRYAEILNNTIPGLHYWGIDPWARYDHAWRSDEYQDKARRTAIERLAPYENATLIKATSLDAFVGKIDVSQFKEPGSVPYIVPDDLDFVFIDGAHDFDNVILDIVLWSRKVRKGGIVSGHDYYNFNGGVIPAVNAYIEAHKIDLNLTLKHAAEHKDDQVPCWWFIKK